MNANVLFFVLAFAVGVGGALVWRTARHQPYATGSVVSANTKVVSTEKKEVPEVVTSPATSPDATVNNVCPICGMEVDPEIPAALYLGRKVGFGCGACPAKFAAHPDLYGPYALRNETIGH